MTHVAWGTVVRSLGLRLRELTLCRASHMLRFWVVTFGIWKDLHKRRVSTRLVEQITLLHNIKLKFTTTLPHAYKNIKHEHDQASKHPLMGCMFSCNSGLPLTSNLGLSLTGNSCLPLTGNSEHTREVHHHVSSFHNHNHSTTTTHMLNTRLHDILLFSISWESQSQRHKSCMSFLFN